MGLFSMLSPYLGAGLAMQGLSKLDPTMKKFIGYGTSAGYGADQILDFLRSRVESQATKGLKGKLAKGEQEGTLRPDERATAQRMRGDELPADIAQGALATGAGIAGGALGAGIGASKELGNQAQAAQIAQQAQPPQIEQNPRIEALKQFNARKQNPGLQRQLEEQFNNAYGQQGQQQQGGQSANIQRLIQLLQARKQGMR